MSKKTIVRGAVMVTVAIFALPAVAAAQEIHVEPAEAFNVTSPGGEVRAVGEPTVTCTTLNGSGSFSAGSTTTGSITRDYTGCHISVFGIKTSCKSEGAETAGTIANSGTFHMITWKNEKGEAFPAILITTNPTKLVCAGISLVTFTGAVIGTISSPACGAASKALTLSFTATGTTPNHLTYTGSKFDLLMKTGEGEDKTAAMVGTATNTQPNAGKLNCT